MLAVRARPGNGGRQGVLALGPLRFACALGRSGIGANKREGDGRTPLATMRVLGGYFRPRAGRDMRPLGTLLPMRPIPATLGWCDAPPDPSYNRPVRLPRASSHERMLRPDGLYDVVLVLDWNVLSRRRDRGSAIFLHLARPGFAPTEGCVAVSRRTMARLLPCLARHSVLRVLG